MPVKRTALRLVESDTSTIADGTRAAHVELLLRQMVGAMRLAVIYGGDKSAPGAVLRRAGNPRSWKSYEGVARDIAQSLGSIGFRDVVVLPDDRYLTARLAESRVSMAWLNSGGVQGQNAISHTPALLEMLGIPFVGHDPLTAALLDSKHHFKRQLQAQGIATAPFFVWDPSDSRRDPLSDRRLRARFARWPNGFIVKPVTGRASLHVHYVERAADLEEAVRHVHSETSNTVLIEAYLAGREYCIAVAGPYVSRDRRVFRLPGPFAFSTIERKLARNERVFTSMDIKPITKSRTRMLDLASEGHVITELESIARQVYVGTPLRSLVRLDIRADDKGALYVLEANPKPDLAAPRPSSTSLICAGLARCGMTYDDLIRSILADRAATLFEARSGSVDEFLRSFAFSEAEVQP